ncbi:aminotransferase class V-fold PLP-dependent enzyme [Actinophytocola sediminis]
MDVLDLDLGIDLPAMADQPMPAQFPGLRTGVSRFDGPGGTLVHAAVGQAIAAYLGSEHVANDHGAFPASRYSDRIVEWAAGRVRDLLGAPGGQVLFGANMTVLTTMVIRALAPTIGPGDEIVCTELDHEANVLPWRAMAAARGAVVRTARLGRDGVLPAAAVTDLIGPRTAWVAVTAASNALGSVPDLPAITSAAHAAGARVFVDGVQAVAHLPVDVAGWGADAFVTSAYKWYGPHLGALWLTDEVAEPLRLVEQVPSAGDDLPGRLDLGTTNFEAVLGTGVAAAVLRGWDRAAVARAEATLAATLRSGLDALPGVRVLGPGAGVPVVSFQVEHRSADEVADRLAERGVSVWHGSFYATPALRAVSPADPSAVRAGIASYTTESDVHALLDAVHTARG